MRIRPTWMSHLGFTLLSLALLLASTAGMAGHDHASEFDRGEHECVADHALEAGEAGGSQEPQLRLAGEAHRHDCVGCHFSGKRLVAASSLDATTVDLVSSEAPKTRTLLRSSLTWAGRTLRGPPAA